jgi:hypothetical protein
MAPMHFTAKIGMGGQHELGHFYLGGLYIFVLHLRVVRFGMEYSNCVSAVNVMLLLACVKKMNCPRCGSTSTKKNGNSHTGKQNHYCHNCSRQFLEDGQDWFVGVGQRFIVDRLLLERIPLAGICRAVGVSEGWLLGYIKALYEELPDHLSVDESPPPIEDYLAERMDEEIQRIELVKKIRIHLRAINR